MPHLAAWVGKHLGLPRQPPPQPCTPCPQGCTVCDLDDEELFYLRSRGLTEAQAREALVFSFGFEVPTPLATPTSRGQRAR